METKLWSHQEYALGEMRKKGSLGLDYEMGTGKTRIICERILDFDVSKNLLIIVCPISLQTQWKGEIKRWTNLESEILGGTRKEKAINLTKIDSGILIVSHNDLQDLGITQVLQSKKIKMLCIDESHRFSNPKAKQSKNILTIKKNCEHVYCLSGTPIKNSQEDIWLQSVLIGVEFTPNFWSWRRQWFFDAGRGFPHWKFNRHLKDKFQELLNTKWVKCLKKDVLDLPPLLKVSQEVEMEGKQMKAYKEIEEGLFTFLENSKGEDVRVIIDGVLPRLTRLLQISADVKPTLDECFEVTQKLETLLEIVEGTQEQIIVWSNFVPSIYLIKRALEKAKISTSIIVGGQKEVEREREIQNFKSGANRILVANQASGGVGLNLAEASLMVYYSRGYSFEQDAQSEARAYRGGSEVHQKITRIDLSYKGTIEKEVIKALMEKKELGSLILNLRK
jgi:SNF2 family DNA or RNA helicase